MRYSRSRQPIPPHQPPSGGFFMEATMRFIVKFGKEIVPNVDFPNNRAARAWADTHFPDRPACSVIGVRA